MRFSILAIIAIWMAILSPGTQAALIDESGCYGTIDCYVETLAAWQTPFGNAIQSGYETRKPSLVETPDIGGSKASGKHKKRRNDSWLDSSNTQLDPALEETGEEGLEFDPEVLSFIADFKNGDFSNPGQGSYARFNYNKTSGFKQIRLSAEDLDHVRTIVSSSSASRGTSDVFSSTNPKTKRPPVEPIESSPFSLQMIIIFHIALFVIAFIVFKLDRA